MRFYLGITNPAWLDQVRVPILISLQALKAPPRAMAPWALDSGAFSELRQHGRWRIGPVEFLDRVRRALEAVGPADFVGAQDWMCAKPALAATGLTVAEHQRRTTANLVELRELAPELPWLPTVQGWSCTDYERHVEGFAAAGVDLTKEPLVGFGTIAARQHDPEVGRIARHLTAAGLRLHGFGVKSSGLGLYADALTAADSAAWSLDARFMRVNGQRPARLLPECEAEFLAGRHAATCAGCLRYALYWRTQLLELVSARLGAAAHDTLFVANDAYVGEVQTGAARNLGHRNTKWPEVDQLSLGEPE